jgi:hypothetical protein
MPKIVKYPRGEKHHATNLTDDDVRTIRKECEEADRIRAKMKTMSIRAIAARHGLSPQTVFEIKRRSTWGHVS